jgi:hypothetical protein
MSTSPWGSPSHHARQSADDIDYEIKGQELQAAMPAGGGNRGEGSLLGPLGELIQGN